MGTIKADSIQPTIAGNNLILRTGSDVERVRISPSGDINVSGSIAVSITGNVGFVGNVGITGNLNVRGGDINVTGNCFVSQKAFSSATTAGDASTTLVTKGYAQPGLTANKTAAAGAASYLTGVNDTVVGQLLPLFRVAGNAVFMPGNSSQVWTYWLCNGNNRGLDRSGGPGDLDMEAGVAAGGEQITGLNYTGNTDYFGFCIRMS